MGVTNVLYDFGFKYQNPDKPYDMEGFVNSADAVKGLEFYKELYKCCTPPGASNVYMGELADAFKSGQVAHAHELRLHLARPLQGPECRRRQDRLLRQPGRDRSHFAQLGGQGISVVANTDNMDGALAYIKWFVKPRCRRSGGSSAASPAPSRC